MIILDTSFIVAYYNQNDVHHAKAATLWQKLVQTDDGPQLLLPEYVVIELGTVLLRRVGLPQAYELLSLLREADDLRWVPCEPWLDVAFQRFNHQQSLQTTRPLSLVDCVLVEMALEQPEASIATFDAGFKDVTGLQCLPT